MLIGCITGPDFETAKSQIEIASRFCTGIELRQDLLQTDIALLMTLAKGMVLVTEKDRSVLSDGRTISIYHNFEETPRDLDKILAKMPKADLYKIATMANCTTDSLRMLNFVNDKPHVAGMCMGPLGQITRILAPVVNNPLNFAAIGKESAPGQLQAEELIEIYNYRALSPKTKIFGLIGNPVIQSPSHRTHNAFFKKNGIDAVYVKMLIEETELAEVLTLAQTLGFGGLSVTIPYKEKVYDLVDVLEDEARAIGAVNTLTFKDKIYGANTDGKGALDAIEENRQVNGLTCVILGAGGSAKAIAYEAERRGAKVFIHSRRYANLENIPPYDILINTTPNPEPIVFNQLLSGKLVMDINVAHAESRLMLKAKDLGCTVVYGLEMFEKQALGQFQKWL